MADMHASNTAAFTAWLRERAYAKGYDVAPRRGGRTKLAEASDISLTAIDRLFEEGRHAPQLDTMRRIAPVLGVSLREMLIRSGQVSPDELDDPGVQESEEDPFIDDIRRVTAGLAPAVTQRMIEMYKRRVEDAREAAAVDMQQTLELIRQQHSA